MRRPAPRREGPRHAGILGSDRHPLGRLAGRDGPAATPGSRAAPLHDLPAAAPGADASGCASPDLPVLRSPLGLVPLADRVVGLAGSGGMGPLLLPAQEDRRFFRTEVRPNPVGA